MVVKSSLAKMLAKGHDFTLIVRGACAGTACQECFGDGFGRVLGQLGNVFRSDSVFPRLLKTYAVNGDRESHSCPL
jgi:hypothetical protein